MSDTVPPRKPGSCASPSKIIGIASQLGYHRGTARQIAESPDEDDLDRETAKEVVDGYSIPDPAAGGVE
jgi:hypothetical protein